MPTNLNQKSQTKSASVYMHRRALAESDTVKWNIDAQDA